MRVVVLGGGRVGSSIAMDLANDAQFEVSVVDVRKDLLATIKKKARVKIIECDISPKKIWRMLLILRTWWSMLSREAWDLRFSRQ